MHISICKFRRSSDTFVTEKDRTHAEEGRDLKRKCDDARHDSI